MVHAQACEQDRESRASVRILTCAITSSVSRSKSKRLEAYGLHSRRKEHTSVGWNPTQQRLKFEYYTCMNELCEQVDNLKWELHRCAPICLFSRAAACRLLLCHPAAHCRTEKHSGKDADWVMAERIVCFYESLCTQHVPKLYQRCTKVAALMCRPLRPHEAMALLQNYAPELRASIVRSLHSMSPQTICAVDACIMLSNAAGIDMHADLFPGTCTKEAAFVAH